MSRASWIWHQVKIMHFALNSCRNVIFTFLTKQNKKWFIYKCIERTSWKYTSSNGMKSQEKITSKIKNHEQRDNKIVSIVAQHWRCSHQVQVHVKHEMGSKPKNKIVAIVLQFITKNCIQAETRPIHYAHMPMLVDYCARLRARWITTKTETKKAILFPANSRDVCAQSKMRNERLRIMLHSFTIYRANVQVQ